MVKHHTACIELLLSKEQELWGLEFESHGRCKIFSFLSATERSLIHHLVRSPPGRRAAVRDAATLQRRPYPNPGHLGSSSHVAIFNRISTNGENSTQVTASSSTEPVRDQPEYGQGVVITAAARHAEEMLQQLIESFRLASMKELVSFWLARGVNLALAEPFVLPCTESVEQWLAIQLSRNSKLSAALSKRFLQNSTKTLLYSKESTLASYVSQFCGLNSRWESFGIFLSAAVRASIDIHFFPSLYKTEAERLRFRHLATALNTSVLELCLSLDCLNDLQLVFQYEHWIVLSYVYGDQSKHVVQGCYSRS